MTAKQTHKVSVFLVQAAVARIFLSCFTFNLAEVSEGLVEAASRGVEAIVAADRNHTLGGVTQEQVTRMTPLKAGGVRVYLSGGLPAASGIQHSKVLVVDEYAIFGSANWTENSQGNTEFSVLVRLNKAGQQHWQDHKQMLLDRSVRLSTEHVAVGSAVREARKTSAGDRYKTAKRFSVARGRSLDALLRVKARESESPHSEPVTG
jgi:phosphatidylserine/phosphatidylglycerophosphate/cardiolipin synthase-like enzyme